MAGEFENADTFSSTSALCFDSIAYMNRYQIQGRRDFCSGDGDVGAWLAGNAYSGGMRNFNSRSGSQRAAVCTKLSLKAATSVASPPA